jgi:hypothetical protein
MNDDITNYKIDRAQETYPRAIAFDENTVNIDPNVVPNCCYKANNSDWTSECNNYYNSKPDQTEKTVWSAMGDTINTYTLNKCYKDTWDMSKQNITDCCLSGKPGEPIYMKKPPIDPYYNFIWNTDNQSWQPVKKDNATSDVPPYQKGMVSYKVGDTWQTLRVSDPNNLEAEIQPYQCRPDLYRFSKECNNEMVEYCAVSFLDSEGNCVPFANDKSVCPVWYGSSVTNNINIENKVKLLANFCKGYKLNEPWCSTEPTGISYGNYSDNFVKKYISDQTKDDIDKKDSNGKPITPVGQLVSNIREYCADNMDTDFCKSVGNNWNNPTKSSGIFVQSDIETPVGYRNILHEQLEKYCEGDNLLKDICQNFCETDVVNGNISYINLENKTAIIQPTTIDKDNFGYGASDGIKGGGYCRDKLVDYCKDKICKNTETDCDVKSLNENKDEKLKKMCGCMLPPEYYNKIKKQFNQKFQSKDSQSTFDLFISRPDCNFSACSDLTTPSIYKKRWQENKEAVNCPPNQVCLNYIEFDINGNIVDSNIPIDQQTDCVFTKKEGDWDCINQKCEKNETKTGEYETEDECQKKCKISPVPPVPISPTPSNIIKYIIGGISILIILILIGIFLYKKYRKN